jgi:hypothetical protein
VPEYVITPTEEPAWRFEADDFVTRVRRRWPRARTEVNAADAPMAAHALVPFEPPHRDLGVALDKLGFAVILDPADPETAAEFVLWYLEQIPTFDPEPRLITDDYEVSMSLRRDTTEEEILSLLKTRG